MEKTNVTIATHSSKFHTDDIFAVATLMLLLEKENPTVEVAVVRTRDKALLDTADYVVDVGGEYDPARRRFDHHQSGGAGARENTIPYASFGLVWKEYGERVTGSREVAEKIDAKLVQPVDASDNGISFSESKIDGVYSYDLDSIRRIFMPSWKETSSDIDTIFLELVSYAKVLLKREIKKSQDKIEARDIVEKIYNETEDKRLVVFDRYYGASEHITKYPEPIFIVFPSDEGTWILETIQDDPDTFVDRKPLPKEWGGKMGEDFEKITGVKGAIFCHNNLFLAVAQTKEAILQLADIALKS